jgi:glycyl-tRNA synthetase
VAVVPLSKKQELIDVALPIVQSLRGEFRVEYDQTGGNIGRRYRRQDEIGTPFCITVDFDTLTDKAVTIRNRDSTSQERVPIENLNSRVDALVRGD